MHSALPQDGDSRRLDVINRGFSGYNTANARLLIPRIFPSVQDSRVRLMTLFFGANDAVMTHHSQHVPLDQYKENLRFILTHPVIREHGTKIIVLTPPPINEYQLKYFDAAKGFDTPSRTAANTKLYADACRDVAQSLGLPVADIWTAILKSAGWEAGQPLTGSKDVPPNEVLASLLTDGLHFTGGGYKIMYDEVMKTLRAAWPEEAPESLPEVFPPWEIAPK
ncbi:hypothetical protein UA08_03606 [Talaromyces atroroseus]|uniref:SGNH hydrolase-type esterase domain-containing protein n=1 Tax=Talaromyces atroroseus TaxID=1441469 RepID=A0A225B1C9_TALAT|nr:hypothetical protein UA08_03606 [Talaromyces atroroseus]OKL61046.1 hypothetical protein UA08_03606 [Talaromyces atroroseus]